MNKVLLILIVLYSVAFASLKIKSYGEDGKKVILNEEFKYSVSDFGQIPYGFKITGALYIADPIDGCSRFGLFEDQDSDIESDTATLNDKEINPIVLMRRRGCSISQKSQNSKYAKSKLILLQNVGTREDVQHIIMGSQALREDTSILPTILISQSSGERLQNLAEKYAKIQSDDGSEYVNKLEVTIDFSVKQTEKVQVELFLDSVDDDYKHILDSIFQKYSYISDFIEFTPVYPIESCINCTNSDTKCIREGKYCPIYNKDISFNGKTNQQRAIEDLRQLCIFEVFGEEQWYKYIDYYKKNCPFYTNFSQCIMQQKNFKDILEDKKLKVCMYGSENEVEGFENLHQPIDILEKQIKFTQKYMFGQGGNGRITLLPSFIINGEQYRGSLRNDSVITAICAHALKPSEGCVQLIKQQKLKWNL